MMAVVCPWGADLSIGPTGDIAVLPVSDELKYRIIRRLLTNPGDCVWHSEYGAGIGNRVGQPFSLRSIESMIQYHIKYESRVKLVPVPKVIAAETDDKSPSGATITIQYSAIDVPIGKSVVFGLHVPL